MTNAPPPGRGFLTNSLLLGPPRWQETDKYPGVICTLGIDWAITTSSTPAHPLPLSKTESSTQGEFSSWILLAFSRLRDSGESEKSFKNKKTHGGPLCQVARVLFSLCSFNTSPLSTIWEPGTGRILYLRWLKLRNRLRPLTNSSMNLVENPELYFIFSDAFAFSPFLINNEEY